MGAKHRPFKNNWKRQPLINFVPAKYKFDVQIGNETKTYYANEAEDIPWDATIYPLTSGTDTKNITYGAAVSPQAKGLIKDLGKNYSQWIQEEEEKASKTSQGKSGNSRSQQASQPQYSPLPLYNDLANSSNGAIRSKGQGQEIQYREDESYDDILNEYSALTEARNKAETDSHAQYSDESFVNRHQQKLLSMLPKEMQEGNADFMDFWGNRKNVEETKDLSDADAVKFYRDRKQKELEDKIAQDKLLSEQQRQALEAEQESEKQKKAEDDKTRNQEKKAREQRQKQNEFLKSNPNIFKMLGKDSGYSFADKMSALGELLASAGANWLNGVAKPGAATPIVGPVAQMLNEARKSNVERNAKNFDAEQEAQAEIAKGVERLKLNPELAGLDDDMYYGIFMALSRPLMTRQEFESEFPLENASQDKIDRIFNAYKNLYSSDLDAVSWRSQLREASDKEYASAVEKLNSSQQVGQYISDLQELKGKLTNDLLDLDSKPQENFAKAVGSLLNVYKGLSTFSNNSESALQTNQSDSSNTNRQNNNSKTDFYEVSAGVKGGIPVVQAHVDTSGGTTWVVGEQTGSSTSRNSGSNRSSSSGNSSVKDLLTLSKLPYAEEQGKIVMKQTAAAVAQLKASIAERIQWINGEIARLEKIKNKLDENASAAIDRVNDGIAKAPHMRQWLVREDGTRIELNPNDNVYATLNELTTAKDDGSPVVHMDQQDRATVYRQRLGYGDGVKTKDFAYYRKLLGRG